MVVMTNEFMESCELGERVTQKKFEAGNSRFINAGPIRYAQKQRNFCWLDDDWRDSVGNGFTNVFRSFLAVKRQDVAVIFRFSAQDIIIEALLPINIVNACLQRDHLLEQVLPLDCQDGLSFRY